MEDTVSEESLEKLKEALEENVEVLAKMEHERWQADRLLSGWRMGDTRNNISKVHTDLVPWKKLSKEVKEKDRDPVRNIVNLLKIVNKIAKK